MAIPAVPLWKGAPFVRLLLPFIVGIMVQFYCELPFLIYWLVIAFAVIPVFLFAYLKTYTRYRYSWIAGISITLLLVNCGALLAYYADGRHRPNRNEDLLLHNNAVIVKMDEPLSEKSNSFKANSVIQYICRNDSLIRSDEHIIVYLEKDSLFSKINFGSRLTFRKPLMAIRHNGNPGAFNYQQYCAFQGIYYQVYLKKGEYTILPPDEKKRFRKFIFSSREQIVSLMRQHIPGAKEAGLAEALLIGYKDDLDKNLVQSYSNTGVVHIIAISGLHVGLIYGILNLLLYPLNKRPGLRWLKAILVIAGLWLFGFLAGGSASVLRSALMFTFIVTGENISRKSSIYNSLASSAFLLLCYNPFWLWDAGFLLSYTAVLSIVVFMKSIYHSLYIRNKLLDMLWKMAAISISAQILTTPLSIFLFHQFPNYFLITNLVAVPLSTFILFAELVLCAAAWLPFLAKATGGLVYYLISLMNRFVEHINGMPFSTWDQLQLSVTQLLTIYAAITATACWLFFKNRHALIIALIFMVALSLDRSVVITKSLNQRKLIVYNVPRHSAIELLYSDAFYFLGDKELQQNMWLRDLYLKPSHNLYRVSKWAGSRVNREGNSIYFSRKKILVMDEAPVIEADSSICLADIVILSGNVDISIAEVQETVRCSQIIFDSSNPLWKARRWANDCRKYGIRYYSVPENGAFILNMN